MPRCLRNAPSCVPARTIGAAEVSGAALGSLTLEFRPGPITPGNYRFAVGTAGSATLVLQTVLPALLTTSGPTTLILEGGTHNPLAPPFDFLARSFVPRIERMEPRMELALRRPGFYPAGGAFRTTKPSLHATTNAAVIQRFLPVMICWEQKSALVWRVTIGGD